MRLLLALLIGAAALPAAAEEVNIYSYRQPQLIQPLLDAFTARTGITANVAYLETGMAERLVAEGSRSPADVILTADISRLAEVKEAGVTQAVVGDAALDAIPAELRDPEGHWFALTTRARIVYASKERVADGEVTTYEALVDPKWRGRICTRPGAHVYTLGLVGAYIAHHGEEAAKEWLAGLKANLAKKPEGNDTGQVKSIWAGECDIALGNTYYMGEMLRDPERAAWADSVRILFPVFEGGGTHVNVSGVAMAKAAPHHDSALKLMEFLASPEAQEIYAERVSEYPVVPGSHPSALVAGWGSFTPDTLHLKDIAANRALALKLVEEVDFDG